MERLSAGIERELMIQGVRKINVFNYVYTFILSFWIIVQQMIVEKDMDHASWLNLQLMVVYAITYSVTNRWCRRKKWRLHALAHVSYLILLLFVIHTVYHTENLYSAFFLLAIPLIEFRHALKPIGISLYTLITFLVYVYYFYGSDFALTFDIAMNNIVILCVFMLYMSFIIQDMVSTERDYYQRMKRTEDIAARMNEEKETIRILYENIKSLSQTLDIQYMAEQMDKMIGNLVWHKSFILITFLHDDGSKFQFHKFVENNGVDELEPREYDFIRNLITSDKTIYTDDMFGMIMKTDNTTIGAIILKDYDAENLNDRHHLLQLLVDQMAGAVNNAIIYHEKEMESITDGLTKVYNKRYFLHVLSAMIQSNPENLYLLMFDIDHFKKFNDTYGHQFGDKVLTETAGIVQKELRNKDFLARYGGEEFVVLFEAPDDVSAVNIAERIRTTMENFKLYNEEFDTHVSITVSIGIGRYHPGWTVDEFIKQVDKCLYESKQQGRNRTTVYTISRY